MTKQATIGDSRKCLLKTSWSWFKKGWVKNRSSPCLWWCPCGLTEKPTPDPHCSCSSEVLNGNLASHKRDFYHSTDFRSFQGAHYWAHHCCVYLSWGCEWGMWPEPGSSGHWTCQSRKPQSAGRQRRSCKLWTGMAFWATWGSDRYQLEKENRQRKMRNV